MVFWDLVLSGGFCIFGQGFIIDFVMERKDGKGKKSKYIHYKTVVDKEPLAKGTEGLNSSRFLDRLKAGSFEGTNPRNAGKKFKNDFQRQVYYLAKGGFTVADIAEFFHVSPSTVEKWKNSNPDFEEAWKEGTYLFGFKVVESLSARLLGYDYVEVEHSQHIDKFGNVMDLEKRVHKHMPPDVEAIKFYLKNRFKTNWSDTTRAEVEVNTQIGIAKRLELGSLTEEERNFIKSIAIKEVAQVHGVSNN